MFQFYRQLCATQLIGKAQLRVIIIYYVHLCILFYNNTLIHNNRISTVLQNSQLNITCNDAYTVYSLQGLDRNANNGHGSTSIYKQISFGKQCKEAYFEIQYDSMRL